MAAQQTKVLGLKDSVQALLDLPRQLSAKNGGPMRRALYAAAKPIRDNAQARAPIASGNLSAHVYVYRDRDPKAVGAAERYIIAVRTRRGRASRSRLNSALGRINRNLRRRGDAYYWRFVEFGTERMKAQPFLRPAFESHKNAAVGIFTRVFNSGVAAAVRRARKGRF